MSISDFRGAGDRKTGIVPDSAQGNTCRGCRGQHCCAFPHASTGMVEACGRRPQTGAWGCGGLAKTLSVTPLRTTWTII